MILISGVILTTNVQKLMAKPLMTVAETDDEFSSTLERCPLSPLTDQDQSLLLYFRRFPFFVSNFTKNIRLKIF